MLVLITRERGIALVPTFTSCKLIFDLRGPKNAHMTPPQPLDYLTGKYIYGIILVIEGHLQSEKVKIITSIFFYQIQIIPLFGEIWTE